MDFTDRKRAAGSATAPSGSRLRWLTWLAVVFVVAVQATLLALTPPGWRLGATFAATALLVVIGVLVALRLARRKSDATLHDATSRAYLVSAGLPQNPDAPSERIVLAYELARRGVPASWIAARCALPHAFVEMIITEVADSRGTPRRRD